MTIFLANYAYAEDEATYGSEAAYPGSVPYATEQGAIDGAKREFTSNLEEWEGPAIARWEVDMSNHFSHHTAFDADGNVIGWVRVRPSEIF